MQDAQVTWIVPCRRAAVKETVSYEALVGKWRACLAHEEYALKLSSWYGIERDEGQQETEIPVRYRTALGALDEFIHELAHAAEAERAAVGEEGGAAGEGESGESEAAGEERGAAGEEESPEGEAGTEGETDEAGWIDHSIPPGAQEGTLRLRGGGEEITLQLGHLDPTDQARGVQQLLRNLGLYGGEVDDDHGERTQTALRRFQLAHGLDPTGEADDATQQALREEA